MPNQPPPKPRYFEDLVVGERYRSAEFGVTQEAMIDFAASFDPQPMHLDEDAGRATQFGALIASGWYTLSLSMRMMVEAKPFGSTPIIGLSVDGIRFLKPVLAGARLHVEAELIALRASSRPNVRHGYVRLGLITFNEAQAAVARQRWTVLVPGRLDSSPTV